MVESLNSNTERSQAQDDEFVTLSNVEINENALDSTIAFTEPDQNLADNLDCLRPIRIIETEKIDTTIGVNLDEPSFFNLDSGQIPQMERQSMHSVPDKSVLMPPPNDHSSMKKMNKKRVLKEPECNLANQQKKKNKYACDKCDKSYTQSHNLNSHKKKHHAAAILLTNLLNILVMAIHSFFSTSVL